jgi:hypothetical protein
MSIGIFVETTEKKVNCYSFIDDTILNFIMTEGTFGQNSVFTQTELAYELDLKFLTKLDGTELEYKYGEKNIEFAQYIKYDTRTIDDDTIKLIKEISVREMLEKQRKEILKQMKDNPRPWDIYFTEKIIIKNIESIIENLDCLLTNNCKTFYFRIG